MILIASLTSCTCIFCMRSIQSMPEVYEENFPKSTVSPDGRWVAIPRALESKFYVDLVPANGDPTYTWNVGCAITYTGWHRINAMYWSSPTTLVVESSDVGTREITWSLAGWGRDAQRCSESPTRAYVVCIGVSSSTLDRTRYSVWLKSDEIPADEKFGIESVEDRPEGRLELDGVVPHRVKAVSWVGDTSFEVETFTGVVTHDFSEGETRERLDGHSKEGPQAEPLEEGRTTGPSGLE